MSRFEEPIRILSDLHLAHPGSRIVDARQLGPLLAGVKTVIFNGDTSEERAEEFREVAGLQLQVLREMCGSCGVDMVMLRGNHDPITPEIGSLDLCEGQVFVTHGDILFEDISPWCRHGGQAKAARMRIEGEYPAGYRNDLEMTLEVTRRVAMEMEVDQPIARPGLVGKLKTMMSQAWPPQRPLRVLKVWRDSPGLAEASRDRYRPGAKVIILGHTHRAAFVQKGGKVVVNTGAFQTMSKALAVDIEGRKMSVRRVVSRGGEFALGKVVGTVLLDPVSATP